MFIPICTIEIDWSNANVMIIQWNSHYIYAYLYIVHIHYFSFALCFCGVFYLLRLYIKYICVWKVHKHYKYIYTTVWPGWMFRENDAYTHTTDKVDKLFLNWYTQLNLNCCMRVYSTYTHRHTYTYICNAHQRIFQMFMVNSLCLYFFISKVTNRMWWLYIIYLLWALTQFYDIHILLELLIWTIIQIKKNTHTQIKSIDIIEFFEEDGKNS